MSETLTQFGTSFQSKIIASLLRDVKFIQTINDILEPDMFDSDSNIWLVKVIRDYFYEYKIFDHLNCLLHLQYNFLKKVFYLILLP